MNAEPSTALPRVIFAARDIFYGRLSLLNDRENELEVRCGVWTRRTQEETKAERSVMMQTRLGGWR